MAVGPQVIQTHTHDGVDAPRLQPQAVRGFFETVSSVPTAVPTNFLGQIKIYDGVSPVLLYVYDFANATWQKFDFSP